MFRVRFRSDSLVNLHNLHKLHNAFRIWHLHSLTVATRGLRRKHIVGRSQAVGLRLRKQVSPHVWVIMAFPNVAIVVGNKATLVVDTGLGAHKGSIVAQEAQKLSKGPRLYLTTTHFHPEHAGGDQGFFTVSGKLFMLLQSGYFWLISSPTSLAVSSSDFPSCLSATVRDSRSVETLAAVR